MGDRTEEFMKIGKRDIEKIVVERTDGDFICEITDKVVEKDSGIKVRFVSRAESISTEELVEELKCRKGVELIEEGQNSILLHIKK